MVIGTVLSKDDERIPVDATKFKQAIGSLMYLIVTCPDLMFCVSLISIYMANPKESHCDLCTRKKGPQRAIEVYVQDKRDGR